MDACLRRGSSGTDMLDVMLRSVAEGGRCPVDKGMHDQLRTLLAAGHDTTATSLTWALYHIYRDDQVRERVAAELACRPAPQQMTALPYLNAVVKESMRMHPPVPIVLRRLKKPHTISGIPYAAGQVVGIGLYSLHFNPEIWSRPDVFESPRSLSGQAHLTIRIRPLRRRTPALYWRGFRGVRSGGGDRHDDDNARSTDAGA